MQKIKLITDSACDIPGELEQSMNIKIMSFPITIDGKGYMERMDFTNDEFYEMLKNAAQIPTTAQITMHHYAEAYKEAYEQGYTDIINVTIFSGGSSTYDAALMAKSSFFEENPEAKGQLAIHIIDSKAYTAAYGYPLIEAYRKIENGANADEIIAYLEDWFSCVEIYFAPYTLKYAKKSGRISCAAAFMGELMGLRPIISVIDGITRILEKVRGDRNIVPKLVEFVTKRMIPQTPYIIFRGSLDGYPDEAAKEMEKNVGYPPVGIYKIGAAIAINGGPKLVGIVVKGQKRR